MRVPFLKKGLNMWGLIANIVTGILSGKNSEAGKLAKLAIGMTQSAKNMPQPKTIGGE